MKKKALIFSLIASFLFQGGVVFAAPGDFLQPCIGGNTCNGTLVCQNGRCLAQPGSGPQNAGEVFLILDRIVNWVFAVVILLSIMFVILAAFEFVTEGPEGVAKARQKLIWAAFGMGVAILARAMPIVLRAFLGVS